MQRNTSSYCNYNDAFTSYDELRQANGLEELLRLFRKARLPVEKQKVIEGGFGTGAYINHIRHHVLEIYGVEGSDEGCRQALRKMVDAPNVHLQVGNILELDYSDDSFDAYMVNQVLHHIDTEPDFHNLDVFLEECRRVLRPGGVLTINTSSQEQLDPFFGVFWSYKYIDKAVEAMRARFIAVDELVRRMEDMDYIDIELTVPSGKMFQERYYSDPHFALEPIFQKGDSVYCFLSAEESEKANARISAAIDDMSVYDEVKRAAARAAEIGEIVIISACTPS